MQQPTAATFPAFNAGNVTNRDRVAHAVFGTSFGSLTTQQQNDLAYDGNAAAMEVTERAQWYAEVNPEVVDLPREWNELFERTWIGKAFARWRNPQSAAIYNRQEVEPLARRIADHYTANWQGTTFLAGEDVTVRVVRQAVIADVIRQRTPVFPPIHRIDREIQSLFLRMWEARDWSFRRRPVKATIEVDGTLQVAGGHRFSAFSSRRLEHADGTPIAMVTATDATALMRRLDGTTGKPKFFYVVNQGTQRAIQWFPQPDVVYTVFAVIRLAAPIIGADIDSVSGGLSQLPPLWRHHLVEWVTARLVSKYGREDTDASRLMRQIEVDVADLWASDNDGAPESLLEPPTDLPFMGELGSYPCDHVIGVQ